MMRNKTNNYRLRTTLVLVAIIFFLASLRSQNIKAQDNPPQLNPAAWGSNHVGQPIPEFVTSGECLFCHRNTIGATWDKNAHGITVRPRQDAPQFQNIFQSQTKLAALANEIEFYLGGRHHLRFLKKSEYGKFAMLNTKATVEARPKITSWINAQSPAWDKDAFTNRCTGCHNTGVDSKDKTFAQFGHDCYACHGVVNLEHTNDTSLILLSKKRKNETLVITSICASCHLRGGTAKSTGLPYPNNFIPGDNLFQDYQVDFAKADDESLNAGDRHIYRNVRD